MASNNEKPLFKPNMTGKEFFKNQVDKSMVFEEPFIIKRPDDVENLKVLCELCKTEEPYFCCPDHCCDVSFPKPFHSHFHLSNVIYLSTSFYSGTLADAITAKKEKTIIGKLSINRNKRLRPKS